MRFNFLEIIVFLSGASVMIVELLATRLIAPYLGYTLFSWTAVIAVILAALSAGYYYGGRLADTRKDLLRLLYGILFIAGIFVILTPLISLAILPLSTEIGIKYGPLFASLFLFAIPAILFGMVLPISAKIRTLNLSGLGTSIGNLYALSTLGSIVGTLLAGYMLISTFGIKQTFIFVGAILVVASVIGMLIVSKGQKKRPRQLMWLVIFVVLIAATIAIAYSSPSSSTPEQYLKSEKDSDYYRIQVIEQNNERLLMMDSDRHSGIYINSSVPRFEYVKKSYEIIDRKRPNTLLAIGLGGGTLPSRYASMGAQVDAVEIDPAVVLIAEQYFNLSEGVNVTIGDGRVFLSSRTETDRKYDVIFVDVYNSHFSIPPHLVTVETTRELNDALEDDGIIVVNVISAVEGKGSGMINALSTTYKQTFKYVYTFPTYENNSVVQNIILVASKIEIKDYENQSADATKGIILTDDYSPVENIMADSFR